MQSSTRKSFRKGLLLGLGSLIVSLLIAELCVRAFFKVHVNTESLTAALQAQSIRKFIQPSVDPALHYELKPNLTIDHYGTTITTDSDGVRLANRLIEPTSRGIRLAILGDSTSFGWRVEYNESYPDIYRQQMQGAVHVPIDLRNFSVPGYNSTQELLAFRNKVVPYKPDLLILHYDHDDTYPNDRFHAADFLHPTYGDNPLNSTLVKLAMRNIRKYKYRSSLSYDQEQHEHIGGYIVSGPLYDEHLRALQEIATMTRSLKIPTIVVVFTSDALADSRMLTQPAYIALHANLVDRLTAMNFYVLDLYPLHQAKAQEMGWTDISAWWISKYDPLDRHPNRDGHRFIANQLVEYTRREPELQKIFREAPLP